MKNNIAIQFGANPKAFFNQMIEHLNNNLDSKLCQSVANLLSLDYANRLDSEPPLTEYISLCIERLKNHLGARVVLDNNFSESMTLFTAAITPEKNNDDDNSKSQEQSQDALIDTMIAELFSNLTPEEQANIKLVIKELLNGKDSKELMNMISSEPETFQKIVATAVEAKMPAKEMSNFAGERIGTLIEQSKQINKQAIGLQSVVGKITLAGGILAAASLGLVVGGFILPALIVPATIAAIKIGPAIGEKIATTIISNNSNIKEKTQAFDDAKIASTNIEEAISKSTQQTIEQNIEANIDKSVMTELSKEQIKSLAKTVDVTSIEAPTQELEADTKAKQASKSKDKPTARSI